MAEPTPKPAGLTRPQTEAALYRLDPRYAYRWLDGDAAFEWRGLDLGDRYQDAPVPTAAQIQAAWDAYAAEQAQVEQQQAAATAERTAASSDLQANYQAAVTRLDQIIAAGTFPNNAARDAAIVDLSRILKRSLRLLKAQLT